MTGAVPLPAASEDTDRDRRCTVCEHELADHDPVSLRYCHATQAHASSRGCICPTSHSPKRAAGPRLATTEPDLAGEAPTEPEES